MLRNQARDHVREERRRHRRETAVGRRQEGASPPEQVLERAELQTRLAQAVFTLPEGQRTVLLLRYFEAMPPRKIAAALDLPVETVRKRQQRGLATLRERLEAENGLDWRSAFLALLPGKPSASSGFDLTTTAVRDWLLARPITVLGSLLLVAVAALVLTSDGNSPPVNGGGLATGPGGFPDLTAAATSGDRLESARLLLVPTTRPARGELRSAGEPLREDGVLLASWPVRGEWVELPVEDGGLVLPTGWELSPTEALPDPGRFRLLLPGSPPCPVQALHWEEGSGDPVLLFEVGPVEMVRILVTDLLGEPIPATRIRAGLPFLPREEGLAMRTGPDGIAQVRVYGRSGSLVVEAEAPGFQAHSESLAPADLGRELHFELRRLLGFGLVFEPASHPLPRYSIGWRDRRAGNVSRVVPMQSQFLDELEEGIELRPGEQIRWVLGFELFERLEDAWVLLRLEGAEEQRTPLLPLIDSAPQLFRIPKPDGEEGRAPVLIRLEPAEAFPDGAPESWVMSFKRLGEDPEPEPEIDPLDRQAKLDRIRSRSRKDGTSRVGHRVGPLEYRYFLEPGEYQVGTPRMALDGGPFLEEFRLEVPTNDQAVAKVRDGFRSIKLSFLDPNGFPVPFHGDLRAAAESPDPRSTRMAWPNAEARTVFLRPGEYRIWWGRRHRPTSHVLHWPEDGWTHEGTWWVPLPEELYQEMMIQEEASLERRRATPKFRSLEEQDEWTRRGMAGFELKVD